MTIASEQARTHDSISTDATRLIHPLERAISTQLMLASGGVTAVVFLTVLLIEGARRPGYDPAYHTGSALSLGDRGWIQIANFLQLGMGMLAFAVGVRRTLDDTIGSTLLGIFGLGIAAAGAFVMDRMRGYPPGTPPGTPSKLSWHHRVHDASGPIAFFTIFGACLALARRLNRVWRLYTLATAAVGFLFTIGTAVAWQRDASKTGLIQRGLLFVYLGWIALLGTHLAKRSRKRDNIGHRSESS